MRKLRMDADALVVESFSPGDVEAAGGTVQARMATPGCTDPPGCATVMRMMSCFSGCTEDCTPGCDNR